MNTEDSNKKNNELPNNNEEIADILKRLSELLGSSVSLDSAVDMIKNQPKESQEDSTVPKHIPDESIDPLEKIKAALKIEPSESTGLPDTDTVSASSGHEHSATEDQNSPATDNSPSTSKIFDELMSCFEGRELPEELRTSINSDKADAETVQNNEAVKSVEEGKKLQDGILDETVPQKTAVDSPSEVEQSETRTFTPLDHRNSEEDELFSQIFSEEKKERTNRERDKKKWQRSSREGSSFLLTVFDWTEVIVLSAAFALLLFTFVLRLAVVDGDSMNNTLIDKEMLIISDLMYTPENSDIIVFNSPNYPDPLVKRIIATEGQTVDIDFETWTVTVDGKAVEEDYIKKVPGSMEHSDVVFPLTVPEGYVFVMGDNRNESLDSRNSRIGLVDERYILGEVKLRLFPLNKIGKVD